MTASRSLALEQDLSRISDRTLEYCIDRLTAEIMIVGRVYSEDEEYQRRRWLDMPRTLKRLKHELQRRKDASAMLRWSNEKAQRDFQDRCLDSQRKGVYIVEQGH